MSYSRPIRFVLSLSVGVALAACSTSEPATPKTAPAAQAATAIATPAKTQHAMDPFGNLRGSGTAILGFELPSGHTVVSKTGPHPVIFVPATPERLVRFFRSRGHLIVETPQGWRFEHTERTLKAQANAPDAPKDSLGHVRLYASQGPGAGWTLRFDDLVSRAPKAPPLVALIEAERGVASPATNSALAPPTTPNQGPNALGKKRVIAKSEVERLRRRALTPKRKLSPQARDIAPKIYEWSQAEGGRPFVD